MVLLALSGLISRCGGIAVDRFGESGRFRSGSNLKGVTDVQRAAGRSGPTSLSSIANAHVRPDLLFKHQLLFWITPFWPFAAASKRKSLPNRRNGWPTSHHLQSLDSGGIPPASTEVAGWSMERRREVSRRHNIPIEHLRGENMPRPLEWYVWFASSAP